MAACAPVQATAPRAPGVARVTAHELSISIDGDELHVTDRMTLSAEGRTVAFRVREGMWIDSLRTAGRELDYEESPASNGRIVRVDVPSFAQAITVVLSGPAGHGVSDEFVYLPGHSGWYPTPAGGRSARFTVDLELPAELSPVAAGRVVRDEVDGDRRRVRYEPVLPVRGWTLTAGRYRTFERTAHGVPLSVLLFDDEPTLAKTYLDATERHLAEAIERFGPYPHPAFTIVEVPFPAGQGHPGYTLLGSQVLRLPFIPDTSARHELFHCWWGNGVMPDPAGGDWTEGLTSYLADHEAAAEEDGDGGAAYRWQVLYDAFNFGKAEPPPLIDVVHAQADRTLGYGKASMVFHMLRREVGDEAFADGLRLAVDKALGRHVGWPELLGFVSQAAGRPLDEFADRWVRSDHAAADPGLEAHLYARLSHADVAPSFDLVARDKRRRVVALTPEFAQVAEGLADEDWPLASPAEADPTTHSLLVVARRGQPLTLGGRVLEVPTDRPWPPGATLLFATSPPWAPGRTMGVMLGDNLDALKQAAGKLRWYSRYSWLLFDGAKNIDKAVFRPR